jgi:KUP system potassium uptake protein
VNGVFLLVDLVFFAANAMKFFHGGWFPLLLAAIVAFLMLTWRQGLLLVRALRNNMRPQEAEFLEELERNPPARVPGTAAYLTSSARGVPLALTNFLRHAHALHERLLLITARAEEVPRVGEDKRAEVIEIAPKVTRLILHFGFMEPACIPEAVRLAVARGQLHDVDPDDLSYFIGRETIIPSERVRGMAVWRETVFAFMQRNAERSAAYFQIPTRQVVEVGTEIEI